MKDRPCVEADLLYAALRLALMVDDEKEVHEISGTMMAAMFNDFMEVYTKWCGRTSLVRGPFQAMAELFTETIRTLCDEDDLQAAEHIRGNTDITMVDLGALKAEAEKKKKKRGDKEK